MESRSRTVTVSFSSVSKSIVMQKGQDCRLVRRDGGVEVHHDAHVAAFERLFVIRFGKHCEHQTVCADGVLDDVGDVLLARDGVDVSEALA